MKVGFDEIHCCVGGLDHQFFEVSRVDIFTETGEDMRFIVTCKKWNRVDFAIRERVERMESEIEQMRLTHQLDVNKGGSFTVTSFSRRGISYFVAICKSSSQLSFINQTRPL